MRSIRRPSRLGTAAVLSALALSLVAVPASAAGKVRVVDNDGKASATNCDATTKTFSKVQKAIDASAAGDIVRVCPGTYREKLTIGGARDGLQVVSTKALAAIIRDPNVYAYPNPPLIAITNVDDVQVRGFKVRALSQAVLYYDAVDGIVANNAKNVLIKGNDIGWAGPADSEGELSIGITAKGGTTGKLLGNTIRDAYNVGIDVTDASTNVLVQDNTLRSVFAGADSTNDGALYGILVRDSATAQVKQNTIVADPVAPGSQYSRLGNGIHVSSAANASVFNGNTITDSVRGIYVVKGTGYTLNNNTISTRQTGIYLADMDNGGVAGNTVKAVKSPGNAITATESSNNNIIEQNVTTGTVGFGCVEQDSSPAGIDNVWYSNTGTGSPAGLCTYEIDPPA